MAASFTTFAQIGIGTISPTATLEVVGQPTAVGVVDGIIAPLIPRADLIAKTAYSPGQTGAIIYITDLSGTVNAASQNITEIGYYYFNGTSWKSMNSSGNSQASTIGDTKQGFQTLDHEGWILLEGRAISTLTATQQTAAATLGFTTNLPDANNSYLVQNGRTLGDVSGSNTTTIAQNQLPNVNYTGNIFNMAHGSAVEGSSNGVFTRSASLSLGNARGGGITDNFAFNLRLNGHVTQVALDRRPQSLSVNTFIYLGN